jgi:hypothetical protein
MVELTDIELFKDFIIITDGGRSYDLHSDYECIFLEYDSGNKNLTMRFAKVESEEKTDGQIAIVFSEARIANLTIRFPRRKDTSTLNTIYRGRFEENGQLFEFSEMDERYFYFIFQDGDSFEVFSKKAIFLDSLL